MKITDESIISEIRMKYKNWVDIQVLAQLYSQTSQEIKDIVKDVTRLTLVPKEQLQSFRKGNRTKEEMEVLHARMRERYDAGDYDYQICQVLDCSSSVVSRWRKDQRLPANKYKYPKETK